MPMLRPAEVTDALPVARVHVRSWQVAYRNLLPNDYLDQLRPEDRAQRYTFGSPNPLDPWTIVAADHANAIQGFTTTGPARDPDLSGHGELYALYVDPGSWRQGIGAALISAARARLVEQGFRHACLWVLEGNIRAEEFYKLDGWTPDGAHRTDTVWGVTVQEIRYRRTLV